jgi:hypothetical protein
MRPAFSKLFPQSCEANSPPFCVAAEPFTGIVRRLFDPRDLKSRRACYAPRPTGILTAEDAFFAARDQHSGLPAVDAQRLGVLAMQARADLLPRDAAIPADADSVAMAKYIGARRVAVHRDIAQFGDIASGEELPGSAVIGGADESVASGQIDDRWMLGMGIVVDRGEERMVVACVLPAVG